MSPIGFFFHFLHLLGFSGSVLFIFGGDGDGNSQLVRWTCPSTWPHPNLCGNLKPKYHWNSWGTNPSPWQSMCSFVDSVWSVNHHISRAIGFFNDLLSGSQLVGRNPKVGCRPILIRWYGFIRNYFKTGDSEKFNKKNSWSKQVHNTYRTVSDVGHVFYLKSTSDMCSRL